LLNLLPGQMGQRGARWDHVDRSRRSGSGTIGASADRQSSLQRKSRMDEA
jgi:hypothetical protein